MRTIHTIALAAMLAASIGAPAIAGEIPTRVVKAGDLNLSSQAGIAVLRRRVDDAVQAVCAPQIQSILMPGTAERQCRAIARRAAADQVALLVSGHATRLASR